MSLQHVMHVAATRCDDKPLLGFQMRGNYMAEKQYGRAANTMNVKEKEAFSYLNDGIG